MDLAGMGKRIEKLRISSNLSRKILSEYLKISEEELLAIERGKRNAVSKEIISKIADLYFCSEDYIIDGTNEIDGRIPFDYSNHDKYRLEGIAKVFGLVREKSKSEYMQPKSENYKELTAEEIYKQRWTGLSSDSNKSSKQIYKEEELVETKEEREQREFEEVQWDEYFFNDFNPYGL